MTLSAEYFDDLYAQAEDPWSLQDRWYERRKYAMTLASLPRERYRSAVEPGCSIGVLSEALAQRCDHLLSLDISAAAVQRAQQRLVELPSVEVRQWALPEWPTGPFDLVVLSEVGYYLARSELQPMLRAAAASLTGGGDLVAVHWRHPAPGYPLSAATVHGALATTPGLRRLSAVRDRDFLLDVYTAVPPDALSVAQREGIV